MHVICASNWINALHAHSTRQQSFKVVITDNNSTAIFYLLDNDYNFRWSKSSVFKIKLSLFPSRVLSTNIIQICIIICIARWIQEMFSLHNYEASQQTLTLFSLLNAIPCGELTLAWLHQAINSRPTSEYQEQLEHPTAV